jgi:uncharacterized membrane protein YfcA
LIEYWLVPIVFTTSCITAVMGMGGGVLLITLMPGLVPAGVIIPIHAFTQLASNLSRAAFGWRHIDWSILPAFIAGAVPGIWLGGEVYAGIDLHWLPAIIGMLILVVTWVPLPKPVGGGQLSLAALGFYQTGLGMLVGATGPLGAAVLMQRNRQRDWLVVNTAVYMTANHLLRVVAFGLIGYSLAPWWQLLAAMVVAGVLGSWVGTRLRNRVPELNFQRWFRVLVTLLAARMIALPFLTGA